MKITILNPAASGVVLTVLDSADASVDVQPGASVEVELDLTNGIQIDIKQADGAAVAPEGTAGAGGVISGSPAEVASRTDVEGKPAPVASSSTGPSPHDMESLAAAGLNTDGSTVNNDTITAGAGNDSLSGGQGNESLDGGAAGSQVEAEVQQPAEAAPVSETAATEAPVAVVSTDQALVGQTTDDTTSHDTVVVTDHPESGEVLLTPVTGDPQPGDIAVDVTTGVPTSSNPEVVLGDTTPAAEGAPSASSLAADDPTAVVTAAPADDTLAEQKVASDEQIKAAIKAVAAAEDQEHEDVELAKTNAELLKQGLEPITEDQHEAAVAALAG